MPDALTTSETKTPHGLQRNAPLLEVYVSSECPNCDEAVRLAEEAAVRYPDVVVRLIDLDELGGNPPPDPVVAVPTYLLNGRVVSLGNPYPEDLFARLHLPAREGRVQSRRVERSAVPAEEGQGSDRPRVGRRKNA
jgi:alkyl hydroperoxide reductase subunit AhpF